MVSTMLLTAAVASTAVNTGIDEEARLPYWEIVEPGVSIRLVQRLPDQTRGFFQARGFSVEDSELIAQGCVFQTVFKNSSALSEPDTIEYNLRNWVVRAGAARRGLKTREDWRKEWSARQAPQSAQLAFEWSLLPTRQTYRPGDYNWGMTLFDLKPGTEFDLDIVWHQDGRKRMVRLKGVRCAADVQLKPGDL
ncbi:MAG: hypothetical protein NUV51_13100 [Sulfuricaulis sp.]|nr:hypothetical protein [Sulfuricaulis sp.]